MREPGLPLFLVVATGAVVADGDTLLVGASTTGFHKSPKFELIAYSIS